MSLLQFLKTKLVCTIGPASDSEPLLAAHDLFEINLILAAGKAFLSFGFCASSVYILNDLLD